MAYDFGSFWFFNVMHDFRKKTVAETLNFLDSMEDWLAPLQLPVPSCQMFIWMTPDFQFLWRWCFQKPDIISCLLFMWCLCVYSSLGKVSNVVYIFVMYLNMYNIYTCMIYLCNVYIYIHIHFTWLKLESINYTKPQPEWKRVCQDESNSTAICAGQICLLSGCRLALRLGVKSAKWNGEPESQHVPCCW